MLVVTYTYQVPNGNVEEYVDVVKSANALERTYGDVEWELLRDSKHPDRWMEIARYPSLAEFQRIEEEFHGNPEAQRLWKRFCSLVDCQKALESQRIFTRVE